MKTISIKQINNIDDLIQASDLLDQQEKQTLEFTPWPVYSYKPEVSFSILYSASSIFIKFSVTEKEIRAVENETNSKVWEDSCVEVFISSNYNSSYYNFEFNCIGTGLIGYGPSKNERNLLPEEIVKQIKTRSVIQNAANSHDWTLTIQIPVSVFIHDEVILKSGQEYRMNFYKCGDLHKTPHFVTWNNIVSEQPNFHLPDFFGRICLR